jgi:hypothetical protein
LAILAVIATGFEMTAPYKPWPKDGCSLAEARDRTADPTKLRKFDDLGNSLRSLGPTPSWIGRATMDEIHWHDATHAKTSHAQNQVWHEIVVAYRGYLRSKKLIAEGWLDLKSNQRVQIYAEKWDSLIFDWDHSTAESAGTQVIRYEAVQVVPALLAPDVCELVAGESLSDVFTQFVIEDPEFSARSREALSRDLEIQDVAAGVFKRDGGGNYWPADLSSYDRPPGAIENCAETAVAWSCLKHRYGKLFGHLQLGRLKTQGFDMGRRLTTEIPAEDWMDPDVWVDLLHGALLQDLKGELIPRYKNIVFHVKPLGHEVLRSPSIQQHDKMRSGRSEIAEKSTERASKTAPKQPKSDIVREALKSAKIDLSTDDRSSAKVIDSISGHLPSPPRSANEVEALQKMINRLRKEARTE